MAVNKVNSNKNILGVFQSKIAGHSEYTAYKYRKTLVEFEYFINTHKLSLACGPARIVEDWCVELLRQELSLTTIKHRLNVLNSLFKTAAESGMINPCSEPRNIYRQLDASGFVIPQFLRATVFNKTLSLIRRYIGKNNLSNIYVDILIFSILNGAKKLDEIIYIKKDNLSDYVGCSKDILERNVDGRRRYVFNLRQSNLTRRQIIASVDNGLKQTFECISDSEGLTFDNLSASLWVALAIRGGATASEALGCIGREAPYAVPCFCSVLDDTPQHKEIWQNAIEIIVTHELPKWYVMKLRRGVGFNELQKEISDKIHPMPELFYPVETIRKKLGGKISFVEQPFISQMVFFRSYPENVLPMFALIGDKAWCLRVSNNTDAPYAVIPQNEMLRFQRAIGVFSADAEIQPLGSLTPKPGEAVILIQPGYDNREALVEEIMESECGTVLFRVKFTTDYGYDWRTTVDVRQIEQLIKED